MRVSAPSPSASHLLLALCARNDSVAILHDHVLLSRFSRLQVGQNAGQTCFAATVVGPKTGAALNYTFEQGGSSAAVSSNTTYVTSGEGIVYALDAAGNTVWSYQLGDRSDRSDRALGFLLGLKMCCPKSRRLTSCFARLCSGFPFQLSCSVQRHAVRRCE
jgi:hypothetical protein